MSLTSDRRPGSANSTTALQISLFQGDKRVTSFSPEYTYAIFGDEESIFGYRNLSIKLSIAAHDLTPHVQLTYDERFKDQGEVQASDIVGALEDFLPPDTLKDVDKPATFATDGADWSPPGSMVHSYTQDGDEYQVWQSSLADPRTLQMLQNIEILCVLMIEGGRTLELTEPWTIKRWKLFLLYKLSAPEAANASRYILSGYATSYNNFTFTDRKDETSSIERDVSRLTQAQLDDLSSIQQSDIPSDALNLPSRERLAQFIILPPFQAKGHAQHLYNALYTSLTASSSVIEFTVEDPNEAFDLVRDIADMTRLRTSNSDFASLSMPDTIDASSFRSSSTIPIESILSSSTISRIRKSSKLASRQLDRLIEMHTLSQIPRENRSRARITRREKCTNRFDRMYYFWRLYTKHRLYQFNRDELLQLDDPAERIEKLEEALESLQAEEYQVILDKIEKREKGYMQTNGKDMDSARKRKRRSDVDEEKVNGHAKEHKKRARRIVADDEDGDDVLDDVEVDAGPEVDGRDESDGEDIPDE